MDFFANQDKARGKTKLLVFYFGLAIFMMILVIYIAVAAILNVAQEQDQPGHTVTWFRPLVLLAVTLGVTSVVGLASLLKTWELRSGGDKVAQMLGGRLIYPGSPDPHERMVMNVVEEMALASGTPVPPVYVLDHEAGINAFAAGYSPTDAVIGVNRGTIETLNRSELQGVIAHEFSHILNGDMRLNIKLIGWLFGIQVLAIMGYYMFRFAGAMSSGRSRDNKNNPAIFFLVIGLVVMIVGFLGQWCASMIQAAISRQREYLADASAVQFTRDPGTISGALKVIGAHTEGSRLEIPTASQASHMFFAEGITMKLGGMATHPPLGERILRIDPSFDGDYGEYMQKRYQQPVVTAADSGSAVNQQDPAAMLQSLPIPGLGGEGFGPLGEMSQGMPGSEMPLNPAAIIAGVGMLDEEHVSHSNNLLAELPEVVKSAIHDPFSARCVVYCLLLDEDEQVRSKQLAIIHRSEGEPTGEETVRLMPVVAQMQQAHRLPCLEIVQSTLSQLSIEQYKRFGYSVIELVRADQKIDLFEFILQHLLLTHLDRRYGFRSPTQVKFGKVGQIKNEIELILSILVHVGHDDEQETVNAFRQAAKSFGESIPFELTPKEQCNFQVLDTALDKVNQANAGLKKQILHAAATAVAADGKVTVDEAELFRAFAESIECPVPPIIATETEA
ncbi:MAG: M48 family metallopeptidase [Planctomycetota bacterium]|nr:M48 family metallopeptidase [Planctomycetota bacterium]